ncbi:Uncharacterized conserved protein, DUF1778 family [Sulfobacillus thermosulfidooxidans DSM 9293]|uniref:Uncharacterized conserved protein, DUF1778 family n=2 Tax=Sulfobacillus thermosulfidooxidans TaxID=28034 RepID=A0A1W1WPE9_SULTA|nr:Uncharacterized conserved protein, DUF1778 family [Sulfobacillus thermosulfidooxidans DSM 9293]
MDKCRTFKIISTQRRRGHVMPTETTNPRRESRLEIRVSAETKKLLDEAAESLGLSTSAFVLATVTPRAQAIVQEKTVMTLNAEESQAFVEQLLNPPQPSETLQKAVARYWSRVDQTSS